MRPRSARTVLLRWVWRLAKTTAVAAVSVGMARMAIIPIIIKPAITIASSGMAALLYGSIAGCVGAFMIFVMMQALLSEEVGVDGHPKWNGWIALSLLLTSAGILVAGRETGFVSSMVLAASLLMVSIGVLLVAISDNSDRSASSAANQSQRL